MKTQLRLFHTALWIAGSFLPVAVSAQAQPPVILQHFKMPLQYNSLGQKPTDIQSRIVASVPASWVGGNLFLPEDSTRYIWQGTNAAHFSGYNVFSGFLANMPDGNIFYNSLLLKPGVLKSYPNCDSSYTYPWNAGYGAPQAKTRYRSDGGNLIAATGWNSTGSGWENAFRDTNAYNAANDRTLFIRQGGNTPTTWWNDYRNDFTYDAGHNITEFIYKNWETDHWQDWEKHGYTYDANNNWLSETVQFPDGTAWKDSLKTVYEYNNNQRVLATSQVWNAGAASWENDSLSAYTYDGNGNRTQDLVQVWNPSASNWENRQQVLYTYDANGNNTSELTQTDIGGSWMNVLKLSYDYNSAGLLTEFTLQYWDPGPSAFINAGRLDFSYNNYDQVILIQTTTWDEGSNSFQPASGDMQFRYYYEEYDDGVGIKKNMEATAFGLYPNPASDEVYIDAGKARISQVQVLDISGKLWYQSPENASRLTIPVKGLTDGIYLLQLETEKGQSAKTFIVRH